MDTIKGESLPIWLKMFSSSEQSENATPVDKQLLQKIVDALSQNKTVTLLVNGAPMKIYKEGDEIKMSPYDPSVKYVIK